MALDSILEINKKHNWVPWGNLGYTEKQTYIFLLGHGVEAYWPTLVELVF